MGQITPIAAYRRLLKSEGWSHEPRQEQAAALLQKLHETLHRGLAARSGLLAKLGLAKPAAAPRGVYLWGGVGRGKSVLMDQFYESVSGTPKRRVHFHAFMLEVHGRIFRWRRDPANREGDPIKPVAKELAAEAKLLCFDEFQVTDTADAMILSRLFKKMFERDVVVVATSNRPPDDLYLGGLNRELFLPFIGLLKERCAVFHLDGERDHRLARLRTIGVFHTPLDERSERELAEAFRSLTGVDHAEPVALEVQGRSVVIPHAANGVGRASFSELCERPLGAADYLAIAETFNTLVLSGIPAMGPEKRNEARRFTNLIDALYEHRVNLICSAEAAPERLYVDGHGAFEFARTVSRLAEMQSAEYMAEPHVLDAGKTPQAVTN